MIRDSGLLFGASLKLAQQQCLWEIRVARELCATKPL